MHLSLRQDDLVFGLYALYLGLFADLVFPDTGGESDADEELLVLLVPTAPCDDTFHPDSLFPRSDLNVNDLSAKQRMVAA